MSIFLCVWLNVIIFFNQSTWINVFWLDKFGLCGLVDSAYMDFHKAFSKSPCQRLLGKLSNYYIRKVFAWIRNRSMQGICSHVISETTDKTKATFPEDTLPMADVCLCRYMVRRLVLYLCFCFVIAYLKLKRMASPVKTVTQYFQNWYK